MVPFLEIEVEYVSIVILVPDEISAQSGSWPPPLKKESGKFRNSKIICS